MKRVSTAKVAITHIMILSVLAEQKKKPGAELAEPVSTTKLWAEIEVRCPEPFETPKFYQSCFVLRAMERRGWIKWERGGSRVPGNVWALPAGLTVLTSSEGLLAS